MWEALEPELVMNLSHHADPQPQEQAPGPAPTHTLTRLREARSQPPALGAQVAEQEAQPRSPVLRAGFLPEIPLLEA